jgi:uncharacterized membrane protein YkvA (DUF1232 family)
MTFMERWKQRARHLKREVYALYLACKDPRVPWYARVLALCVVGYAFSPIDLIPDFIPVLGHVDDLILIPLGVAAVIKLIPPPVLSESRDKAQEVLSRQKPTNWIAAGVIVLIWLLLAAASLLVAQRVLQS